MEYLIWLVLGALIVGVIWWKNREGGMSEEDKNLQDALLGARANTFLGDVTGKEKPVAPATRTVRNDIRPSSPPPAPPMRTTSGKPGPTPPTRPVPPPVMTFRNEKRVVEQANTTSTGGIGLTDVVLGALVLDALSDDKPKAAEWVDTTPSTVIPEPERYMPDPTPSTTSWDSPSSSDNDSSTSWSSSDTTSSSDW